MRDSVMTEGAVPWPIELDPSVVRERFLWARRQGHPRYLWPEVEPAAWRIALREIERVARSVLSGSDAELVEPDARALGVAACTSGMGPLLGYWIEHGRVDADDPIRTLFQLHLRHGRRRVTIQRSILARVLATLRIDNIDPVVLKSTATGELYFPEAGTRPGVDIDLVVEPAQFERAERALWSDGHQRVGEQVWPRKSDWRVPRMDPWPRSLDLMHSDAQYGIDLHASLTRDYFGIRSVTIDGDTEELRLPLGPIRILAQPARLAFHALHASEGIDNLTMIRLVEIVLMIWRDAGRSLDWAELLDMLERAGGVRFAWPALALAERLAPGTVDPATLRALEAAATPAMRSVVSNLCPANTQRLDVLPLRERFMWCSSAADYARRFLHMLVPAPAGRSPSRLRELYAERLWRLYRRNVSVGRRARDTSHGPAVDHSRA